jgi:hypothetical protein
MVARLSGVDASDVVSGGVTAKTKDPGKRYMHKIAIVNTVEIIFFITLFLSSFKSLVIIYNYIVNSITITV